MVAVPATAVSVGSTGGGGADVPAVTDVCVVDACVPDVCPVVTVGEAPVVVLAAYDAVASAALDASGSLNPPASTSGWEGSEVSTCWQAALEQLGVHEQLGVRRVLMPED